LQVRKPNEYASAGECRGDGWQAKAEHNAAVRVPPDQQELEEVIEVNDGGQREWRSTGKNNASLAVTACGAKAGRKSARTPGSDTANDNKRDERIGRASRIHCFELWLNRFWRAALLLFNQGDGIDRPHLILRGL
jgi:hypothetical protein